MILTWVVHLPLNLVMTHWCSVVGEPIADTSAIYDIHEQTKMFFGWFIFSTRLTMVNPIRQPFILFSPKSWESRRWPIACEFELDFSLSAGLEKK